MGPYTWSYARPQLEDIRATGVKPQWWGTSLDNFDFLDDPTPVAPSPAYDRYPHFCPACAKAAYIGINKVLCSNAGCKYKE